METAITRERMIKMKMLPAVLNQLLLSNTSTQHLSFVMSFHIARIIHKHASLKARLIQSLPVVSFARSNSLPRFPRGISDNDQSFSEAVNLKMLKRKT